jgi:hypothetical protein
MNLSKTRTNELVRATLLLDSSGGTDPQRKRQFNSEKSRKQELAPTEEKPQEHVLNDRTGRDAVSGSADFYLLISDLSALRQHTAAPHQPQEKPPECE